ncbi:MAG: winged helix-turn-helix transcriptional regulator [Thermoplasmatales archaeon]|jgi:predicted ArsR family transcriptional regulator|nr:winged helix-turn-helix transcriptional regulator [Cuniculiplasma sp.]WMT48488.1 MAG: winged helix-turn-helix transcriptional regulator [Thermoplasmatales archaeon]
MDTRTEIQLLLEKEPRLSTQEIANHLGLSKMAILKHIEILENAGIVERSIFKGKVGRPFYRYSLVEDKMEQPVNSDSQMLQSLLDFLMENGNETLINSFLEQRQKIVLSRYREKLKNVRDEDKLMTLAALRKVDNYFPEIRKIDNNTSELVELNCPILKIAVKNGKACTLETSMFGALLEANVESIHKKINGNGACRFIIRKQQL